MTRLPVRLVATYLVLVGCLGDPGEQTFPERYDEAYFAGDHLPGGATSVADATVNGLGRTARNLAPGRWPRILDGKRVFQRVWSERSGKPASCSACHFRDGRGGPPSEREPDVRLVARLAVVGGPFPVGGGRLALAARMPGALTGTGLLEAIPAGDILAAADPDDRDGDGISGRASWVPDHRQGRRSLGRFGWKAGQPTVEQQIATAFRDDLGVTSWLRPGREGDRAKAVSAEDLANVVTYTRLLGVPARRELFGGTFLRGRKLFVAAGCAACHTPRQVTGASAAFPELAGQVIFPYTDLLLHDLGDGLADRVPEFEAQGREWRTPPLWGLGLLAAIHGRLRLLHDGRARSVEEAIRWHEGEAGPARAAFGELGGPDREALVRFVESL